MVFTIAPRSSRSWAGPIILLLSLLLVCFPGSIHSRGDPDGEYCENLLKTYRSEYSREADPFDENSLIFFLHVPRTAGRTFHQCMLRQAIPRQKHCPKSYAGFHMGKARCSLLSSHDDFSIMNKLPENVAVMTHLRDPVDRFLSAYEFAIEVASRTLRTGIRKAKRPGGQPTTDVWPWSELVPFFMEDIKQRKMHGKDSQILRRDDRGFWVRIKDHDEKKHYYYNSALQESKWELDEVEKERLLPELDPYDNPMYMTLKEFAESDIAHEVLHNGGLYQMLGISNYSQWELAGEMRNCITNIPMFQRTMFDVALNRIQRFTHVGVTDKLMESAEAAAASFNLTLTGPAYGPGGGPRGQRPQRDPKRGQQSDEMKDQNEVVTKARLELIRAQKELFKMSKEGASEGQMHPQRAKVDELRAQLRREQEALMTLRSIEEETAALPTQSDGDGDGGGDYGPGESRKLGSNLGTEFQKCADRSRTRSAGARVSSLDTLAMEDGRRIDFSKQARKQIPADVIDTIRHLSWLDTELHEAATSELSTRRDRLSQEGRLLPLPHFTPRSEDTVTRRKGPAPFYVANRPKTTDHEEL